MGSLFVNQHRSAGDALRFACLPDRLRYAGDDE